MATNRLVILLSRVIDRISSWGKDGIYVNTATIDQSSAGVNSIIGAIASAS
jgi:hypothetical protein